MTQTMVEKMARAMCLADGKDPEADWRYTGQVMLAVAVEHPETWRTYIRRAKAALLALMEPTEGMVEEGMAHCYDGDGDGDCERPNERAIFTAMIQAAIDEVGD